jgi:ATP-dependent helicase Lhr and Lhr-like helicase
MLEKAREGRHALLVADTGAGKTLGGFLPTLCDFAPSAGRAACRMACTRSMSRR